MCAGNAVFSHAEVVSESKIVREMLCCTIETAVGGCEGRRCETAVAAMVAYGRLWAGIVGSVRHWEVESQVVKRNVMVASRWCWARGKCMQRVVNRIVMVVLRWVSVVGLRRCARGKCMQRVANRIVMVVSRWVWVVGLRHGARGSCFGWQVCGAVLGGSAFRELQSAL